MNHKINHFVLVFSCFVYAQQIGVADCCEPSGVRSGTISGDYVLSWSPPPEEPCIISHYLVYVLSGGEEKVYTSEETALDVSYLPPCASVQFTIIPVSSDDVEGGFYRLHLSLPVPTDANVTIQYIGISSSESGHVTLSWDLDDEWKLCTNRFRVLIYELESDTPGDFYVTSNNLTVSYLVPCTHYTFGVTAIHSFDQQGPVSIVRYTTPAVRLIPPTVQSLTVGTTSVSLEWHIDSYIHNRCEVTSIVVNGSPHFTVTYPVHDDIERPLITTNVANLQPENMYFLNVTVVNTAGPSKPTLIGVQTLPDSS
ncbi:hypothetical protein NQ317_012795 [Molorchus minor]|uniref:Fibronectin type-III domain-containing protein n=1 Tax=Molorchus minor TaxID=1323400 RepID=A0ABQ9K493_9CUCU|nr:hypothetical protein NQ317_012795 [Molorchus minor]